ncbi:hypothetical protein ACLQ3C_08555 [Gordonia sp. DT30]|uniref:hypothetical protein n=1 Tax=unclassified Gordonia (in: high G+C Gram-positive bacteria) TaxID=2657482 RepID=UPI003CFA2FE3
MNGIILGADKSAAVIGSGMTMCSQPVARRDRFWPDASAHAAAHHAAAPAQPAGRPARALTAVAAARADKRFPVHHHRFRR